MFPVIFILYNQLHYPHLLSESSEGIYRSQSTGGRIPCYHGQPLFYWLDNFWQLFPCYSLFHSPWNLNRKFCTISEKQKRIWMLQLRIRMIISICDGIEVLLSLNCDCWSIDVTDVNVCQSITKRFYCIYSAHYRVIWGWVINNCLQGALCHLQLVFDSASG